MFCKPLFTNILIFTVIVASCSNEEVGDESSTTAPATTVFNTESDNVQRVALNIEPAATTALTASEELYYLAPIGSAAGDTKIAIKVGDTALRQTLSLDGDSAYVLFNSSTCFAALPPIQLAKESAFYDETKHFMLMNSHRNGQRLLCEILVSYHASYGADDLSMVYALASLVVSHYPDSTVLTKDQIEQLAGEINGIGLKLSADAKQELIAFVQGALTQGAAERSFYAKEPMIGQIASALQPRGILTADDFRSLLNAITELWADSEFSLLAASSIMSAAYVDQNTDIPASLYSWILEQAENTNLKTTAESFNASSAVVTGDPTCVAGTPHWDISLKRIVCYDAQSYDEVASFKFDVESGQFEAIEVSAVPEDTAAAFDGLQPVEVVALCAEIVATALQSPIIPSVGEPGVDSGAEPECQETQVSGGGTPSPDTGLPEVESDGNSCDGSPRDMCVMECMDCGFPPFKQRYCKAC